MKNYLMKIKEIDNYDAGQLKEIIKGLLEDLKHKKIAIQNRKARIKDLEKQIEKMKCCENCKGVCNSDDVAHFCKNNDYKLWEIRK